MDKEEDHFITTFYHPDFPQLSPIPEHFLWNLQWVNFPFAAYFARKASTLFLKWLLMHFTIGVAVSLKKDLQVSVIIWARIPSSHDFLWMLKITLIFVTLFLIFHKVLLCSWSHSPPRFLWMGWNDSSWACIIVGVASVFCVFSGFNCNSCCSRILPSNLDILLPIAGSSEVKTLWSSCLVSSKQPYSWL